MLTCHLFQVILVFPSRFWTTDNDAFGLLQTPDSAAAESVQMSDYAPGRGAFHIFWDTSAASTQPTLVAMMAGHAAEAVENISDAALVGRALSDLGRVFGPEVVPAPVETFITRWRRDLFARGSYSYISVDALATDHDTLAIPAKPLFFAGEATSGTHPATVHGAYLSGLRVASEVLETLVGPIQKLSARFVSTFEPGNGVHTKPELKPARKRSAVAVTSPGPAKRRSEASSGNCNGLSSGTNLKPGRRRPSSQPSRQRSKSSVLEDSSAMSRTPTLTPGGSETATSGALPGSGTPGIPLIQTHRFITLSPSTFAPSEPCLSAISTPLPKPDPHDR